MFGKKGPKEVVIGTPRDIQHNIHVNKELDWHIRDPDASFKLEEKLGEGSFGVVYKAMHLDSLHEIAVKIIEVDLAQTMDLQNEIGILKKCQHPNIVSYFGSCATEKKLWILMDYCGLGSVRDVMETCKRTLTEKEIACVLAGTLQGLRYLHHFEQPIIHKDIKAANILLNELGEVKLADFGVAQQILTTLCLGYLEGTPHFMAPEIGYASKFNFKADIWSLGITAIEMADGRPPYADINIMRAIHMIRRYPPPTLKDPKKWSKEFNDFISRCLVKDYNDRASAEDLLQHPFITGAKPQAMKELVHEALKAKKKSRAKLKKELSSPPLASMSRWRTKKARSLVVHSTFEHGNHGSVVILNTVNVRRGDSYHSSDDSSLGTSNSSHETNKTLSSSGSSYGTVKLHETPGAGVETDTVRIVDRGEGDGDGDGDGDSEYGTIQFNASLVNRGNETVRFHESAEEDSDSPPRVAIHKKRTLSSSYSSLPSPQLLSESDESHTDAHAADAEGETSTCDEAAPKPVVVEVITKHETPTGTKETRSIGVQTDLPLDLQLFMDSVMRKKRHKRYTETHELKHDYNKSHRAQAASPSTKRNFFDRISGHNKSHLNNYHEIDHRKLSISSSGPDDTDRPGTTPTNPRPKVPPLQNLPILLDLTTSGEHAKLSKTKTPRSKSPKTPKTPKTPKESKLKETKTPRESKSSSELHIDPAASPRKSPRKKFSVTEYLGNLLGPTVVTTPFVPLFSSVDSITETEPSLKFCGAGPESSPTSPLGSSTETIPTCSPPSSPTASSIDSALDSSLDSLRSSIASPSGPPVSLKITVDEEEEPSIETNRDSPYITPYSTTDESSDSAPSIVHTTPTIVHTAPFAATSPAPFTGPLPCKPQENSPVSSLLLSPPMSSSAHFVKNTTPNITPETTPVTSPDGTPREDDADVDDQSQQRSGSITPSTMEKTSSALDAVVAEALNAASPSIVAHPANPIDYCLDANPGTPRPTHPTRNSSPLIPPDPAARTLARVNATSKLGDKVKAAMHNSNGEPPIDASIEIVSAAAKPKPPSEVSSLSVSSPPKQIRAQANSPTSKSPARTTPGHRVTHSAPVLPTPPFKPIPIGSPPAVVGSPPAHDNLSGRKDPIGHSKSSFFGASTPKPPPPTGKLTRTTSMRSITQAPESPSTARKDPISVPSASVENIKQTLHALSSSPPKAPPLKRTASILNSSVLAAFLPKSAATPPTSPTASSPPSNTMVKNLTMAFSAATSPETRPRSSSGSASSAPVLSPPPIVRSRASTISGTASPLSKPAPIPVPTPALPKSTSSESNPIPIPKLNSSSLPSSLSSSVPLTPVVTRIPKRTSSNTQPISYAAMRQNSNIPLPRATPKSRSATDLTKATLEPPKSSPPSSIPPTIPECIFEPPPVAITSSPEMSSYFAESTDDIPPLSLTPSPPSTPPSSRSPSPESSSPSPRSSPRDIKSPSLLSSSISRPFNRHAQHALEASTAKISHTRSRSHTHAPIPTHTQSHSGLSQKPNSSRASPQPSPSPLRRTISSAVISPPRIAPSSSPIPIAARSFGTSTPEKLKTIPESTPEKLKPIPEPTPEKLKPPQESSEKAKASQDFASKSKSPKDSEKSKSPKSKEISDKSPPSPKEGFSIRLPGGVKFPSYTPRSPRRSRHSPRSPRPTSATKNRSTPSPLISPFSPEPSD